MNYEAPKTIEEIVNDKIIYQIECEMSLLSKEEIDCFYDAKSRYEELYEQEHMDAVDDRIYEMVERDYAPEALQEALKEPNKW